MGGWRSKLVLLLVVYFAGFATAIYCLAPTPIDQGQLSAGNNLVHSAFKSDEFAKSFNTGMHKAIDFAKQAVLKAGVYIKEKYDQSDTGS